MLEFPSAWDAAMWLSEEDPYTQLEVELDLEEIPRGVDLRDVATTVDNLCCGTGADVFLIDGHLTWVLASWGH